VNGSLHSKAICAIFTLCATVDAPPTVFGFRHMLIDKRANGRLFLVSSLQVAFQNGRFEPGGAFRIDKTD
jgi:hypothetical protein